MKTLDELKQSLQPKNNIDNIDDDFQFYNNHQLQESYCINKLENEKEDYENKILSALKNKEKYVSLGTFFGMYADLLCRYLKGYGYSVKTIKIDKYPTEWEIQINLN